jgi:hypothetical protein
VSPPARPFRVIDGHGEVDEHAIVLPSDIALLVEQNAKHLRTIAALKGQLTKLYRVDPQAETIMGLLVYWRNVCRGPLSKVDISLDGKRAEVVRKTLRRLGEIDDFDGPEHIRCAIDGCARFPYEGRYGMRFAEPAKGLKRKDELTYILRDEIKLEQFANLAEGDARRLAYAHDLYIRLKGQPNLRLVFASLDPSMAEIHARAIKWCQAQERAL